MRRTSYQLGSLKRAKRKRGEVWEFRWREVQIDGSIRRKNIVIGTLDDYPNESRAKAAVDALRLEINQQTPQQLIRNITLETLANHYRQQELPDVFEKRSLGWMGRQRTGSHTPLNRLTNCISRIGFFRAGGPIV